MVSQIAIFFIIWWISLFLILPVGLRTQGEENDVTLGTVASAPAKPRMGRAVLLTTLLACVIFALYYYVTHLSGLSLSDIPHFFPDTQ